MPHYITIPESDIDISPDGKPVETTFVQILKDRWLNDSRFGVNLNTLRAGNRIEALFEKVEVGDEICLNDDDWGILAQAADSPKTVLLDGRIVEGYAPQLRKRALRLAEAVTNAPTTPQTLSEEEAAKHTKGTNGETLKQAAPRRAGA